MNEEAVKLWIQKADDDLRAAKMLVNTGDPITWIVCFHAQQAAEKYLKAFVIFHGQEHPRTHNISVLVHQCAQIEKSFSEMKEWGIRVLTRYAIALRYGEEVYIPDVEETQKAIKLAEQVQAFVRKKLAQKGLKL